MIGATLRFALFYRSTEQRAEYNYQWEDTYHLFLISPVAIGQLISMFIPFREWCHTWSHLRFPLDQIWGEVAVRIDTLDSSASDERQENRQVIHTELPTKACSVLFSQEYIFICLLHSMIVKTRFDREKHHLSRRRLKSGSSQRAELNCSTSQIFSDRYFHLSLQWRVVDKSAFSEQMQRQWNSDAMLEKRSHIFYVLDWYLLSKCIHHTNEMRIPSMHFWVYPVAIEKMITQCSINAQCRMSSCLCISIHRIHTMELSSSAQGRQRREEQKKKNRTPLTKEEKTTATHSNPAQWFFTPIVYKRHSFPSTPCLHGIPSTRLH